MSILLGVLLGAAIALLLVLVPVIALQVTLRFFGPPASRRRSNPTDQGRRAPSTEPRPRPLGLFRAIQ